MHTAERITHNISWTVYFWARAYIRRFHFNGIEMKSAPMVENCRQSKRSEWKQSVSMNVTHAHCPIK